MHLELAESFRPYGMNVSCMCSENVREKHKLVGPSLHSKSAFWATCRTMLESQNITKELGASITVIVSFGDTMVLPMRKGFVGSISIHPLLTISCQTTVEASTPSELSLSDCWESWRASTNAWCTVIEKRLFPNAARCKHYFWPG